MTLGLLILMWGRMLRVLEDGARCYVEYFVIHLGVILVWL